MKSILSIFRVVIFFGLLGLWRVSAGAALPANFYDTQVASGIDHPTAMAFAPDGRLFVCQQFGALRVIKNGTLLPTPFMTLAPNTTGERGLLGTAFDPNFTANGYLYVYYTFNTGPHNRVSRFTADPANPDTVLAGSEQILLDLPTLGAQYHNGGALHFGADGRLYIAVGENTVTANAQAVTTLLGKILRMNSDGSIPTDNPFYSSSYMSQPVTGTNRLIYCLGLRNPFTFNFQPGTGRLFINDVGNQTWEEINDGEPGVNYGWSTTEGWFDQATYPDFTLPTYTYNSAGTGPLGTECAITGGTFYNPLSPQFPGVWVGRYFFSDYCSGWIRYIDPPASGVTTGTSGGFATGYSSPVGLEVGPDAALYVLTGAGTAAGGVARIYYATPTDTPTPSPTTTATATLTPVPTSTNSPTLTPTSSLIVTPTPTLTMTKTPAVTGGGNGESSPALYPNPVRDAPFAKLLLNLTESSQVRFRVYTAAHRRVEDWVSWIPAQGAEINIPLTDKWGTPLANGLYYVSAEAGGKVWVKKLILAR